MEHETDTFALYMKELHILFECNVLDYFKNYV